jgi:two-component system alkaline phosphatase synthesis response regulator PhoP
MKKILVAEDERDIRELITFTLKYSGFEVVTADNGEDALALANDAMPDLLLLDVRMPRLTGFEVCERIKQRAETRHLPVVFLSAKGQEAEIQQGQALGAADYILKPFSPQDLVERITNLLPD